MNIIKLENDSEIFFSLLTTSVAAICCCLQRYITYDAIQPYFKKLFSYCILFFLVAGRECDKVFILVLNCARWKREKEICQNSNPTSHQRRSFPSELVSVVFGSFGIGFVWL